MNPVNEFYKVKKTHELTKEMSERYHSIYSLELIGNLSDDWKITILLDNSLFKDVKTDERWEIYKAIQEYINEHREKIKACIIKRLEKRMEIVRDEVLRDFKLIGSSTKRKKGGE